MLNVEVRLVMQGEEVSVNSFIEAVTQQVRNSIREEIGRNFLKQENSDSPHRLNSEKPPHAVSIREAARLLSISPRTVDKYVGLKVIRTVRVGRRVLVPMASVNEVVARGIPWRRDQKSAGEQRTST